MNGHLVGAPVAIVDAPDSTLADLVTGTSLKQIADGGVWFEGPAWVEGTLIWSDVVESRLHAWTRERGERVWIEPSFHQNGHTVDGEGRLVAASHGERAIVRREHDGSWIILGDLIDGHRFNSPNDVVVARDQGVWFTDPSYGLDKPAEGFGGEREVDGTHVYRIGPRGLREPVRNMTAQLPAMPAPNGLAFSNDESVLYVTDSVANHILGFPVRMSLDGPELGKPWVVHQTVNGWPDGIRVDPAGRIWSSSTAGVEVIVPGRIGKRGRYIGTIQVPEVASNLAFAPDFKRLAITATSGVYLLKVDLG